MIPREKKHFQSISSFINRLQIQRHSSKLNKEPESMTRRRLKNTIVDMSTSEKLSERGSCIETKRVLILSNNSNSTQSPGCYLGAILFTAYISLFRLFSPQFKAIYCTKTDGLQSMKVSPFPLLTVCMDLNVEISQWTN